MGAFCNPRKAFLVTSLAILFLFKRKLCLVKLRAFFLLVKKQNCLLLFSGVFLICWVPFFTCNILDALCTKLSQSCQPGVAAFILTTWLGYFNSFVNPVIYTIFNPEFRKAFKKIMSFGNWSINPHFFYAFLHQNLVQSWSIWCESWCYLNYFFRLIFIWNSVFIYLFLLEYP